MNRIKVENLVFRSFSVRSYFTLGFQYISQFSKRKYTIPPTFSNFLAMAGPVQSSFFRQKFQSVEIGAQFSLAFNNSSRKICTVNSLKWWRFMWHVMGGFHEISFYVCRKKIEKAKKRNGLS